MALQAGERQGPTWYHFQCPPLPILLSHCFSLQLLQYNPKRRLGSGGGGITKLKSHSFFSTVPWNKLVG